ncbi:hypothetical protein EJ03DRAFT_352192 [Teratosphaeria nubilosa]|uniref:CCHC-type domain-containing protein n=1 Tax=Teratosphaeria nubilosa TaxID=161662 RepID=A0A6G1L7C8_9PEZI|nr:hypothetical protein EJ03DRAFT_352192 [Teratosphaeria nubilosa]
MTWRPATTSAGPAEAYANRHKVDTVLGCIRSLDWTPKDFIENLLFLQGDSQLSKHLETTARATINMLTNSIQDAQLMKVVSQSLPNQSWRRQCYHVMSPHLCCVPIDSCMAPGGKRKAEVAQTSWVEDEHTSKYLKTSFSRRQTGPPRPAQIVPPKLSFATASQAFTAINRIDDEDDDTGHDDHDQERAHEPREPQQSASSSDTCALCGQTGHDLEACTSPLFGGDPGPQSPASPSLDERECYGDDSQDDYGDETGEPCYHCGNHGHTKQRCPHLVSDGVRKRPRKNAWIGPRRWIPWTPHDDARLLTLKVQSGGRLKYGKLREEFPGRTPDALRVRVRFLEGRRDRT